MSKDNCNEFLRQNGKAHPRTCKECGLGKCKFDSENTKRPLSNLTKDEYYWLQKSGFLFEFYPEATGDYYKDCQVELTDAQKVEFAKKYIPRLLRMEMRAGYENLINRHNEAFEELYRIFK